MPINTIEVNVDSHIIIQKKKHNMPPYCLFGVKQKGIEVMTSDLLSPIIIFRGSLNSRILTIPGVFNWFCPRDHHSD